MKKLFLLLSSFLLLINLIKAQESSNMMTLELNRESVVKDSSGLQYSFEEWQEMMRSGKYGLKSKRKDGDISFITYRLNKAIEELKLSQ